MARETSGGRIGRTVYLPSDVWEQLLEIAEGDNTHPAVVRHETRHGSVSFVIEQIVTWEGAKEVVAMRDHVAKMNARLREARDMQSVAEQVARELQTDIAKIVAVLLRFRKVEL